VTRANRNRSFRAQLDAAVAARRAGPPGIVAAGHCAQQLVYVVDEIALAPVEVLLELLELRSPPLDAIFPDLHVCLELRFPLHEVALEALQLAGVSVARWCGDGVVLTSGDGLTSGDRGGLAR